MKQKFYDIKPIMSKGADYNIIFGERSNGKTYAVLKLIIEGYAHNGNQGAIIRRWGEDFKGKRGASMFDALVANNEISKATGGKWSQVLYYSGRWYFCNYDENGNRETDDTPFCWAFSLASMEHDKSTSYPKVKIILFDEFITRTAYLPDEFILFVNTVSTIVRHNKDIKIFMCGNTVNRYGCPYFSEMGLKHVREMQPGDIDVYTYGESELKVAVEYVKPNKQGKESDKYFAFDNPKLQMITGGAWEVAIYPHCPCRIRPKDVLFKYYIVYDGELMECEIVSHETLYFTFVHRKTSELKELDTDLIYSTEFDPRPNFRRRITKPRSSIEKKIAEFYIKDKIFYDTNETGELMRNYLIWCERG